MLFEIALNPPSIRGHWRELVMQTLPAGVVYATEEWSEAGMIMFASLISAEAATVHAIAMNVHLFANSCAGRSFGESALALVGKQLGVRSLVGGPRCMGRTLCAIIPLVEHSVLFFPGSIFRCQCMPQQRVEGDGRVALYSRDSSASWGNRAQSY